MRDRVIQIVFTLITIYLRTSFWPSNVVRYEVRAYLRHDFNISKKNLTYTKKKSHCLLFCMYVSSFRVPRHLFLFFQHLYKYLFNNDLVESHVLLGYKLGLDPSNVQPKNQRIECYHLPIILYLPMIAVIYYLNSYILACLLLSEANNKFKKLN